MATHLKGSLWLSMHAAAWNALTRLALRKSNESETGRRAVGDRGEREAYFYLRRAGYTIVARQWRAPNLNGELDLVAWYGDVLCFIEVKTRSADDRYAPGYRMNARKCNMLRRMARAYVHTLPWPDGIPGELAMRFDLVSVVSRNGEWIVEHRPGVFAA